VTSALAADRSRLPTGSPRDRYTSTDPADFPVPRGREEEWRFSPVTRLRPLFEPYTADNSVEPAWTTADAARVEAVGRSDARIGSVLTPADRVSALALAGSRGALAVTIPAEVHLDEPVRITLTGKPGRNCGHVIVDAGRHSRGVVILEHVGEATVAANVEVLVGEGATLTLVSVQDWNAGSVHVAAHAARVGRDASYKHVLVDLGGSIVRISPTVDFAAPGGMAELFGLSFAGRGQHLESRLYIDHGVPNCTSNVMYKNALMGETARTVWIGDVRIRPGAIGTSTYELNRNLLLSDGARADSVPNLEIETGEIIGAGHASATGRFDDEQLFYLQSRGIPEDEARRLVVRGFFADVIARIGVPDLQERLTASIEARLGYADTTELEN
jgi:Fe-S cluster assembly protein SufD